MKISTKRCGPVTGSLSAADRSALPLQCFALPGRRYPLYVVDAGEAVPDAEHAANAKARASQAHRRGELTHAEVARVEKAANRVIALCRRLRERATKPASRASSCGCTHTLEQRVLKALPGLYKEPLLQLELEDKLQVRGPLLEITLRKLHVEGKISREFVERGGKALNAWRRGQQPPGTRGRYTVKVYCDDGRTHRHGVKSMAQAQRVALEERGAQPGPCSVHIVDASGVIVKMWEEDGKA